MQQPDFQHVQLDQLRVSATLSQVERREHLDKKGIAELAESIATVGILQPLVVRRVNGHMEIVAGERRFLAAKLAKLDQVPVNVRELTDEQVLEVQLVENLQREDVHPMAEAEGYESLRRIGRTADEIADKVGKSKAYVYARMKLLELCTAARKAYYAGELSASVALLVARIPVEQLQKDALKEITRQSWNGPMSARNAAIHIHDHFMLKLGTAGFKTEDPNLVPAAGACGACPKRTGNQPQLFGDVKGADVCTDPVCFKSKVAAHAIKVIEKAQLSGQKVIAGEAAEKVAKYGIDSDLAGYVRLNEKSYSDPKMRTFRQVLGKDYEPTLLQDPKTGKVIEVAPDKDLPKGKSDGHDRYKTKNKAEDKKRQQELAFRADLAKALHAADFDDDTVSDLRLACEAIAGRIHHDGIKRLFKVMGWEPVEHKDKYRGTVKEYEIEPHLKGLDESGLWKMLRLLSIAGELEVYSHGSSPPDRMLVLAKRLKVNAQKIRDSLVSADKAKAKQKKPAKRSKAK